jgi:hypothetical protein
MRRADCALCGMQADRGFQREVRGLRAELEREARSVQEAASAQRALQARCDALQREANEMGGLYRAKCKELSVEKLRAPSGIGACFFLLSTRHSPAPHWYVLWAVDHELWSVNACTCSELQLAASREEDGSSTLSHGNACMRRLKGSQLASRVHGWQALRPRWLVQAAASAPGS